jgi:hypothetical protein
MKELYQSIRTLKLQILSSIAKNASITTPGFPIFLALIMLLMMPFIVEEMDSDTALGVMTGVYSLLVIGVIWKFVKYMRENSNSRLDEIK